MNKWKLFIYVPAYNSEKSISELLERLKKMNKKFDSLDAEIKSLIIVNDGSTDRTVDIVNEQKESMQYLKLIDKATNEGAVSALFDGMEMVSDSIKDTEKTIVVRMDSDLEHQPEDIEKLIGLIITGKTKIAVGYTPFDSRTGLLTKWFNQFVGLSESRKFLGIDIPQFCPGFNAMRGDLFKKIYPRIKEKAVLFEKINNEPMLTIDFVTLETAKKLGEEIYPVKLTPIEDKWIKKPKTNKIMDYFNYHLKTVKFLENS